MSHIGSVFYANHLDLRTLLRRGRTWHHADHFNNIYTISDTMYAQTWKFYDHEYHVQEIFMSVMLVRYSQ
jgi:hypothetical protein